MHDYQKALIGTTLFSLAFLVIGIWASQPRKNGGRWKLKASWFLLIPTALIIGGTLAAFAVLAEVASQAE